MPRGVKESESAIGNQLNRLLITFLPSIFWQPGSYLLQLERRGGEGVHKLCKLFHPLKILTRLFLVQTESVSERLATERDTTKPYHQIVYEKFARNSRQFTGSGLIEMIVASLVLTFVLTKRLTTFSVSSRDLSRIKVRELNETS